MSHEYGDPLDQDTIDAAVSRVLDLQLTESGEPILALVERAIHETFCACAIAIEDQVEGRRSGLHKAIAQEVHNGVKLAILAKRK